MAEGDDLADCRTKRGTRPGGVSTGTTLIGALLSRLRTRKLCKQAVPQPPGIDRGTGLFVERV